eukprot:CAMPEP_0113851324 /NCGR_PEP_ID=MMETSP0372-20130328/4549_1 /TAXON_ID=340204 /ORGANISM="Lankesteria abbotti" /LENGTH=325 /DNA_ID=CAMNT_0000822065 /DNA_START=236 /DNA_END=1213 /DNA_ORIENTATION=- /assembly_acc=CAM_ASM_000359
MTPREARLYNAVTIPEKDTSPHVSIPGIHTDVPGFHFTDRRPDKHQALTTLFRDFVLALNRGVTMTQMAATREYVRIHCSLDGNLQVLTMDQNTGRLVEFPTSGIRSVFTKKIAKSARSSHQLSSLGSVTTAASSTSFRRAAGCDDPCRMTTNGADENQLTDERIMQTCTIPLDTNMAKNTSAEMASSTVYSSPLVPRLNFSSVPTSNNQGSTTFDNYGNQIVNNCGNQIVNNGNQIVNNCGNQIVDNQAPRRFEKTGPDDNSPPSVMNVNCCDRFVENNSDYIVVVDFEKRKLIFVFGYLVEAEKFQLCMEMLAAKVRPNVLPD